MAILLGCAGPSTTPELTPIPVPETTPAPTLTPMPGPPQAPSNLIATTVSHNGAQLKWVDNADDEDGFRIYRDGTLVTNIGINANSYPDTGLQPATTYQYTVIAYNQYGDSQPCNVSILSLNPPIVIRLDGIGVYDNRENILRGTGDVYVIIGLIDGNNPVKIKFPSEQDQTYALDKNETMSIGDTLYSTSEVSDVLQIMFVGYESDGGTYEQLAYEALGMAINAYVTGGLTTGLAEAFDISLSSIIGQLLGEEHDLLGQYELRCDKSNNWGIGQYADLVLQDERGVNCLRLWFTIESSLKL
jgi:hypothetical protein